MWRTTYHEPCKPVRVLADNNFADCIVKFIQASIVINDGAMTGHVELHYDGGLAARHPSTEHAPNPIVGMLDAPAPMVRNPWIDAPRGGFTPRTAPSKPSALDRLAPIFGGYDVSRGAVQLSELCTDNDALHNSHVKTNRIMKRSHKRQ